MVFDHQDLCLRLIITSKQMISEFIEDDRPASFDRPGSFTSRDWEDITNIEESVMSLSVMITLYNADDLVEVELQRSGELVMPQISQMMNDFD